jgi:hypothetical protein
MTWQTDIKYVRDTVDKDILPALRDLKGMIARQQKLIDGQQQVQLITYRPM